MSDLSIGLRRSLAQNTPFRTGYHASNWLIEVGEPADGPVGSEDNVTLAPAKASEDAVRTYDVDDGEVYVTNNAEFIIPLNRGSSKQQPRGFVQRSIRLALSRARRRRVVVRDAGAGPLDRG